MDLNSFGIQNDVKFNFKYYNEETERSWYDLIQDLSVENLETLRSIFKTKNEGKGLTKEDFLNAFNEICTDNDYSKQSIALYKQIQKKDSLTITWSDFLAFLMQNLKTLDSNSLTVHMASILTVPQTRRETIVKIVLIETEKYFCYAMVSKHGRVGLYDGNLNFLTTYHLIMTREDINRREEDRRRRNRWVTDAIFCSDTLLFIVTNTARSIVIYEASGLKHVPLWLVLSTPNTIECFAYKSSNVDENGQSTLFMGDDSGVIISFIFLQPKISLFRKKHNDKINLIYWDELPDEKEYIIVKRNGRPHHESIRHLMYFDDNETLLSCSRDSAVSIIIKYLGNKSAPYIFKMPKGCNCFALSRERKILISGSQDGILRLWNPIITSKPIAVLKEHQTTIVDVKIMSKPNLFMSCSYDGVFKMWNIKEQKCIKSFTINFPSFSVFGKLIEWGIQSIYPGPKRNCISDLWERSPILISCCNHIALLKICKQNGEAQNDLDLQVLPAPPLQNSVLVPNMWKTSDDIDNTSGTVSQSQSVDSSIVEKRLEELGFILKKDLFGDNDFSRSDINYKIATLERKKLDMQQHVARGAPYLALNLHEVKDLHLTPNLPVPNKRKIKNIVEKIEKVLEDASCRDVIFSEPSSSRSPRSSRSSIVEFEY